MVRAPWHAEAGAPRGGRLAGLLPFLLGARSPPLVASGGKCLKKLENLRVLQFCFSMCYLASDRSTSSLPPFTVTIDQQRRATLIVL